MKKSIMATFKTLPKTQLRSGAHFTEMEAFAARVTAAAFTPAKLAAMVTQFNLALAEEDKCLKQSTSSIISKQLRAVDAERDKIYSLIKQTIELWASRDFDPQTTAAKALKELIDLYKIDIHAQYDQETGLLTNIITDMELTDNAAHIKTLALTDALAKLKELNEQMKTLMAIRSEERGAKVNGALKKARKATDAVYNQLTNLIEAYAVTADDSTPYDAVIIPWNAEIDRVRKQIGVKTSSSSSSSNGSSDSGDGGSVGV